MRLTQRLALEPFNAGTDFPAEWLVGLVTGASDGLHALNHSPALSSLLLLMPHAYLTHSPEWGWDSHFGLLLASTDRKGAEEVKKFRDAYQVGQEAPLLVWHSIRSRG